MSTVAFAYKNLPEILNISSSGGAFLGIAQTFFEKHGGDTECAVYGASWTKNLQVIHTRVDNYEDCKDFCGSKYVQSDLSNIFKEVENDLRQQRAVLFTGTPCQVAATKMFLDRHECNRDKLLTVDIACHGTPPASVWDDYRAWLETREKSKLIDFSFRYKSKGWKGYPILAVFESGKRYENKFQTSHYMTMFRKDLLMRPSCFNCKYPDNYQSDITIADFWGIELCMPQIPPKGGVSLLLCHTDKGKKMAIEIGATETPDNSYLRYNQNLSKHTEKPVEYEAFWEEYKNKGFEFVLKKYGGNTITGRIKFNLIRLLRDTGAMAIAKRLLRKA